MNGAALQAGSDNYEALGTFSELQNQVTEWAEETFPDSTTLSNIDHLRAKIEEIDKLARERLIRKDPIGARTDSLRRKIASAQLLLMHLASREGIDLHEEALVKHGVDRASVFGPTPGKSYWTRQ